jgi:hypothetical protein
MEGPLSRLLILSRFVNKYGNSCFWLVDFGWPNELKFGRKYINEMSNLYKGPSIDDSYQVIGIFGKAVSEKTIFRNRPIRNKNWLCWPCEAAMAHNHFLFPDHWTCSLINNRYMELLIYILVFRTPCQRQRELLPSLGVRRLLSVNFSHVNLQL